MCGVTPCAPDPLHPPRAPPCQVRNVSFSEDDRWVLSVGGNDGCLFQWRYVPTFPEVRLDPQTHEGLRAVLPVRRREERAAARREARRDRPALLCVLLDDDLAAERQNPGLYREALEAELRACVGTGTAPRPPLLHDCVRVVGVAHEAGRTLVHVLIGLDRCTPPLDDDEAPRHAQVYLSIVSSPVAHHLPHPSPLTARA